MHRHFCATVVLEGGGAEAVWTKRALTRIGYEVMEASGVSKLRIRIAADEGKPVWEIFGEGECQRVGSLRELVSRLLGYDHEGGDAKK